MKNKKQIAIVSSVLAAIALIFSGIAIAKRRRDRKEWIAFLVEDDAD